MHTHSLPVKVGNDGHARPLPVIRKMKKKDNIERFSFILIIIGLAILLIAIVFFFIGEEITLSINEIKSDKVGQFGDLIGGLVGSMWALAGVLLFYAAFKKQIEALENQKLATQASQQAIRLQSTELELQRKELKETRQVFQEQEKTLKLQQFENIFFSLLNLFNSLVNNMDWHSNEQKETKAGYNAFDKDFGSKYVEPEYETITTIHTGRDFFNQLISDIENSKQHIGRFGIESEEQVYENSYDSNISDLEPYYKLMKQILIKIESCAFENKKEYLDIFSSQISSIERELINYFNSANKLDQDLIDMLKRTKIE